MKSWESLEFCLDTSNFALTKAYFLPDSKEITLEADSSFVYLHQVYLRSNPKINAAITLTRVRIIAPNTVRSASNSYQRLQGCGNTSRVAPNSAVGVKRILAPTRVHEYCSHCTKRIASVIWTALNRKEPSHTSFCQI